MTEEKKQCKPTKASYIKFAIALACYLAFLLWVESWWGLLVVPFIYDIYVSKKINWGWWKTAKSPAVRGVMSWVDAIVFALVAIYFLNQFFFQNFVIPSSSLEKTMLTGDYLLVSKLSYGPRIPQTPLTMPLTQHTLPVVDCKSYSDWPHWDYRRVKGLGRVRLNDIVVFNYPGGDTVALNCQDQDYYRLVYGQAQAILGAPNVSTAMGYEEQQAEFARFYALGSQVVKQHETEFGKVVARPTDRRENYVKRCVGLPGQWLRIKDNIVYLDGKANAEPENVQYGYFVRFRQGLPEDLVRELGVTLEDLSHPASEDGYTLFMPLTKAALQALRGRTDLVELIEPAPAAADWLYPQNMAKDWTTANYGPVWIPKKGKTLKLSLKNLPVYERPIRVYEGNTLEVRDGKIFINGKETDSYTFKMDYYWMMGDNRDLSADSRFWGFVPEDHVVGKPLFVWLSLNPDYGYFDGKVRWNRIFKWVGDIK